MESRDNKTSGTDVISAVTALADSLLKLQQGQPTVTSLQPNLQVQQPAETAADIKQAVPRERLRTM